MSEKSDNYYVRLSLYVFLFTNYFFFFKVVLLVYLIFGDYELIYVFYEFSLLSLQFCLNDLKYATDVIYYYYYSVIFYKLHVCCDDTYLYSLSGIYSYAYIFIENYFCTFFVHSEFVYLCFLLMCFLHIFVPAFLLVTLLKEILISNYLLNDGYNSRFVWISDFNEVGILLMLKAIISFSFYRAFLKKVVPLKNKILLKLHTNFVKIYIVYNLPI